MPLQAPPREVIVVGAGIVGVCCALYLRREGYGVTLIDRAEPGSGASLGNAGNLGIASCVPHALPGVLAKVPKMLFDGGSPLRLRWSHLPQSAPWLARFVAAAAPARVEAIADARNSLLSRLYEGYEPLIAMAGAADMIRASGLLFTYESDAAFAAARYGLDLRRNRGVEVRELSGDEARDLEPALSPAVTRAAFFPRVSVTVNPQRLTQVLAECFVRNNGMLLRETVQGFDLGPDGVRGVRTDGGLRSADRYVIAAGVWSRALAKQVGPDLPLAAERGYHAMIPDAAGLMRVPAISGDRYVALTPMEHGLRVSGMAEFAAADAPADWRLIDRLMAQARRVLPGLHGAVGSRWVGSRPSFPDSKPVIGPSPRRPEVLYAFGHDHIGLALAGITGRIVADLVAGRDPGIDLAPFRPDRF
ncbi:MAG: NAD(P)/FAD-dependent oxidoreductase [Alphaproteobacteria bacterium]